MKRRRNCSESNNSDNNYLIIGSYSSQHIYNFICVVLRDADYGSIHIFSDTGSKKPEPLIEKYYEERGIRAYFPPEHSKKRSRISDAVVRYYGLFKSIKKLPVCKYTFVHFLSNQRAVLSLLLSNKTHIIPVTYGSDILRNRRLGIFPFNVMFKRAYKIVFNLKNLRNVFESHYHGRYADKCEDILFATTSLHMLQDIENKVTRDEAKDKYNLPHDKYIVVCGHTATQAEQHTEMISALCKCKSDILNKCCFVFPMSYAPGDFVPYRDSIEAKLEESGLDYRILKEYLPYYDSLMIHIASDIHIAAILTDALSFFLREEVYTGSALIYGKWLNYYELDNADIKLFPFDSLSELPEVFGCVVSRFSDIKNELMHNKGKSIALMSEDGVFEKWSAIINQKEN
ncbi:MAG TPA: hypothetical protein PLT66_03080 [Bacillota bacterium]|nr:hypothetical protein [Bacillota bacterium]